MTKSIVIDVPWKDRWMQQWMWGLDATNNASLCMGKILYSSDRCTLGFAWVMDMKDKWISKCK